MSILPDITYAIGQTPMVDLSRLIEHYNNNPDHIMKKKSNNKNNEEEDLEKDSTITGHIYAKLEYFNPGFSKKDRIAKELILDALQSGELRPGQTVVELTSGNTGTGLAIVCSIMKHPFVAVMSVGNSIERVHMMKALNAEVILVQQAKDSTPGHVSGNDLLLVEQVTQKIVKERNAFRANQFVRLSNAKAHYKTTGPEIWDACNGTITAFCDFVGTGGSFVGCAAYFKQQQDSVVKCYIVEPVGAAVLSGEVVTKPNHRIQGGGYIMNHLPILDQTANDISSLIGTTTTTTKATTKSTTTRMTDNGQNSATASSSDDKDDDGNNHSQNKDGDSSSKNHHNNRYNNHILIDGYVQVTEDEAIQMTRDLAKYEGIFAGFSAGANVAAAIKLLQTKHSGESIAVLICDSGLKYLSTDLWK